VTYDLEELKSGRSTGSGFEDVLRTGKSVCQGFANLFEKMCTLAGIECVTIPGYARGYSFSLFDAESPGNSNHAWSAVRIAGEWKLVDATWDAGGVTNGKYEPRYNNDYFLADPTAFIHSHLPSDSRWQLLEPPLSATQFAGLPYLKGSFFAAGLRLVSSLSSRNSVGRTTIVELSGPEDVSIYARVQDRQGRTSGDQIRPERSGDRMSLTIDFPSAGNWDVTLFVSQEGPGSVHWDAAHFRFQSGAARVVP
jgi:transglutaminase/protease-like cytokinesis protein 3